MEKITKPKGQLDKVTIIRPDDWHLHVREGESTYAVVPHTAEVFGRAIIMPNLKPAVTTTAQAIEYHKRIMTSVPKGSVFKPLMTLYLTDNTSAQEILRAEGSGLIYAVKYYPAGATTNSDAGVTDLRKTYGALEMMQRIHMPLLLHGEANGADDDIFDREKLFVDRTANSLLHDMPELKIVLEHTSTKEGVEWVMSAPAHVGATLTPQHMRFHRNSLFVGGIRPHYYCMPILKRKHHRDAVLAAATSGNPKFFLGTDSAPHATHLKENASGCAGCFSSAEAMGHYATAFDSVGKLDKLEGFASVNGAKFYGLPLNDSTITLVRKRGNIPQSYEFGEGLTVTPLAAGDFLEWWVE